MELSVIFITKNEAYHIKDAIENVRPIAKEIFIVDSGSTDGTQEIAKGCGAQVLHHDFTGFGAQWNWALENCPVTTKWTMKMDPDERLSDALKEEILAAIQTPKGATGFSFDRILWFMGKPLRGVRNTITRVWLTGKCHFSDVLVNEHPLVDGPILHLKSTMDHHDSRDLSAWLAKQNNYTQKEAEMRYRKAALSVTPKLFGTAMERRMWFKRIFFHVPGRYFIHNLYLFFLKGAWKSGLHGYRWVKCREMVMRLREYKYIEKLNKK